MNKVKKGVKWFLLFLLIPIAYVLVSLVLSSITVNNSKENQEAKKVIYLTSNGVHLSVVIPSKEMDSTLAEGLKANIDDKYVSFGWGDENFYLNTPTWGDLTFKNAFRAMFLKSSTLMHVTRYASKRNNWIAINLTKQELEKLSFYIQNTFKTNENEKKIILENQGYGLLDEFYLAIGSYSIFKTCNTWVNTGFKESGLKSCFWTPFDFGLLNKYK